MPPRRVPIAYIQGGRLGGMRPDGSFAPASEPAPDVARKLYARREALYIIDLDGQFNGACNLPLFQQLERRQVFAWIDAGCRKPEDVMDVFFAGAESVTLQLRHLSPEMLEEVGEIAEAEIHLGFTVEGRGLEKGLRPADVVGLVERVGATGVVLYEGPGSDFHSAENIAFELQRAGIPTTWVERAGSPNTARAQESDRFAAVVAWETPT